MQSYLHVIFVGLILAITAYVVRLIRAINAYEYKPLTHPLAIRVLVLHGARSTDADLVCNLKEVSLRDRPKYAALSYEWGSKTRDREMKCGGKTLYMTENCEAALRALRPKDPREPLTIWVDALCINQSCIAERNAQVAVMGKIYSEAEAVVVWLGQDTPASMRFFDHISGLEEIERFIAEPRFLGKGPRNPPYKRVKSHKIERSLPGMYTDRPVHTVTSYEHGIDL